MRQVHQLPFRKRPCKQHQKSTSQLREKVHRIDCTASGIPPGLTWLQDSLSGYNPYALAVSAKSSIFLPPCAGKSQGRGTCNTPLRRRTGSRWRARETCRPPVLGLDQTWHHTVRHRGRWPRAGLPCFGSKPIHYLPIRQSRIIALLTTGIMRKGWIQISTPWKRRVLTTCSTCAIPASGKPATGR